ncbi:tetratricopeptide repeat protein [Nonlabens ponticola]|nr:tetratricopeptide repeat protein [Nonlabens ponticola]
MITILSNNKKLLRSKRYFHKEKSFLNYKKEYLKAAGGKLKLEQASQEELLKIRKKILANRKRERNIYLFASLLIACICVFSGYWIYKNQDSINSNQQTIIAQEKQQEALRFIQYGDEFYSAGKWNNAIYNYKKARQMVPADFDVNYRLVRTYALQCDREFINCAEAKTLLDKMYTKFPSRTSQLNIVKEQLSYEY